MPQAASNIRQIWDRRFRQESPARGPLTLVYADASMFVDPYRPQSRPAMMIREPYPTNAAVLARVQQLSGRVDFHTPFVLESDREDLWNAVELDRIVKGEDHRAPTLRNLLHMIAESVRSSAAVYVRDGAEMPTPEQKLAHEKKILVLADELERLSQDDLARIVSNQIRVEEVFKNLLGLGTKAPDDLVSAVFFAFTVFDNNPVQTEAPKMVSSGNYAVDYRGYEITYQSPPIFPNRWVVNLSSTSPHLINRLGRANIILEDITLEGAVNKAKRYVDGLR